MVFDSVSGMVQDEATSHKLPTKRGDIEQVFRKRILGLPFPLVIGMITGIIALLAIGFLSGAIGRAILGDLSFISFFSVEKPLFQLAPETIFRIGSFDVTNTLITSWITMAILVLGGWTATHRMKIIPDKVQNLLESLLEWMLNFCIEVAGEKNGRRFFPLVTTLFLFILVNAWMNLIPGFGAITVHDIEGNTVPLLRGANTDINVALAFALISFVFVLYAGFKARKIHFFRVWFDFNRFFQGWGILFRGKIKSGFSTIFMGIIDIFIGLLELVSYFSRIVSFTFRLFGNMTAGEILIVMMIFLIPWILAIPFYGLELLVGAIQALVFAGLTLVFGSIAVAPHETE